MMLKIFGINKSLQEIKKEMPIKKEGVSAYDIITLAKKYQIDACGYKNVDIKSINTPFIAHIINTNNTQHFIVVLKVFKDKLLIADPASKIMYINKEEFLKKYTKIAITFTHKENFVNPLKFTHIIKHHKTLILKLIFYTILFILVSLLFSYFISFIIDCLENKIHINIIFTAISVFFIIGLLKNIIFYFRSKISFKFQLLIDEDITIPTLNKLIDLPQEYYHLHGSGELISKINDLSYLKELFFKLIDVLVVNAILIISSLIVISYFNFSFLFINFILIIIIFIINKNFNNKNLYLSYDLQCENQNLNNKIVDTLGFIIPIKNLSKESFFKKYLSNSYNVFLKKYKKFYKKILRKELILSILILLVNITTIISLIKLNLSVSNIVFIFSLENIIIESLLEIEKLHPLYLDFKNAYLRVKELYLYKEEVNLNRLDINIIEFKNFSYDYDNKKVLKNVSFKINKNDYILVNGTTSVGKSTLFKVLTKQIKYNEKNVLVNKKPLSCYSNNQIKENIIYVDQKIKLFNSSVKNNIFFEDKINKKVLDTVLLDYSMLDIIVDNTNSNLSGGQLSKIAIARALNRNKDIIILDETTCFLDEKEERKILTNIKHNFSNKTIILISHRNTNINLFDKVITINAN